MNDNHRLLKDGLLVVFEGIDGVGKTTQLQLVQEALEQAGWPVYTTRNLGGTPVGEKLREVIKSPVERPSTTNLYISVAIQEALIEAAQTWRDRGQLVLMDRGPVSLAAYEIYGGGLDPALGWQHVDDGMARLKPELTIIYEADVDKALEHARQKGGQADYFESKPRDYFERVAEGYRAAAERYSTQTVTIDANQPIEAIQAQTMQHIERVLAAKAA